MDIVEHLRTAPTRLTNVGANAEKAMTAAADEIERLRAALRPFAECKTTSTGDRDDRHWQCLVSAQHLSDARDALGLR